MPLTKFKVGQMVYTTYFPSLVCHGVINLREGRRKTLAKVVKHYEGEYILTFPNDPQAGWRAGETGENGGAGNGLRPDLRCWAVCEDNLSMAPPEDKPEDLYKYTNNLDDFPFEEVEPE